MEKLAFVNFIPDTKGKGKIRHVFQTNVKSGLRNSSKRMENVKVVKVCGRLITRKSVLNHSLVICS